MSYLSIVSDLRLPTQLSSTLFIGPFQEDARAPRAMGFDVIVLCAGELQGYDYPGVEVLRVPLDDTAPSPRELEDARDMGERVARRLAAGKKVIVTCQMGINRSALVCAIALRRHRNWSGAQARRHIQQLRQGSYWGQARTALSNKHFAAFLNQLPPPRQPGFISTWHVAGA